MSQESVDLIRRMYRVGEAMNLDELISALPELIPEFADPQIEWIESPTRIDRRTYRGYEGVRQAMQHWLEDFDAYSYEPQEILDCGDDVLVVSREQGRGRPRGGIPRLSESSKTERAPNLALLHPRLKPTWSESFMLRHCSRSLRRK